MMRQSHNPIRQIRRNRDTSDENLCYPENQRDESRICSTKLLRKPPTSRRRTMANLFLREVVAVVRTIMTTKRKLKKNRQKQPETRRTRCSNKLGKKPSQRKMKEKTMATSGAVPPTNYRSETLENGLSLTNLTDVEVGRRSFHNSKIVQSTTSGKLKTSLLIYVGLRPI